MSTAHRGMTNHELVESIERCHRHLLKLGFTDEESTRGAVALTCAFSDEFTRAQAWAAANEIAAKMQRSVSPPRSGGQKFDDDERRMP